jgi:capsule polysaccharide export protein KpsE/RkpR
MVALHNWKKLAVVFLATTVVSYGFVRLLIKPTYKAVSLVIPFEEQTRSAAASLLKGIANIPLSSTGLGTNSEQLALFQTVLSSRTTLMSLSDEFGLKKKFRIKRNEDLLKLLRKLVGVDATNEDALYITCIHTSPDTAAAMTNYLVDLLNTKVIELNVHKAKSNREFLGKRLRDIRAELEAAEDSMTAFQEKYNVVELREQIHASLQSYAAIESELYLKEIERGILQRYLSTQAPQMALLDAQLSEIKQKLAKMKRGTGRGDDTIFPLEQMPQKLKEYLRLQKNIRILLALEEIVLPMYEQARYEEQKSIPVLQVIDEAVPPQKKHYPPRTLMAGMCGMAAGLLYLFVLFMRLVIPTVRNPAWVALFRYLKLSDV